MTKEKVKELKLFIKSLMPTDYYITVFDAFWGVEIRITNTEGRYCRWDIMDNNIENMKIQAETMCEIVKKRLD